MKTLRQRRGIPMVAPICNAGETSDRHTGGTALSDPDDDKVPDRSTNPLLRCMMCIASRTAKQRGFTLIELMITVGVIAILTAIAYPSYTDYVIRGKIPDALSTLAAKRVQLEQFFQDKHTYDDPDDPPKACDDDTDTSHYFDFSCTDLTQTAYTLQAVGKDSMDGFTFTIDEANHKTTTDVPSGWSLPNPNTCWVTKKGGEC